MVRIEQFVEDVTVALADGRQWPTYVALPPPSMDDGRCYFGSIPDLKWHNIGYALAGVDKGSPAERAGLQGGDVITQFGQSKIEGVEDFDAALRTYHSGQHVLVAARRHGKPLSMGVTLTQRR
jgi:S1-C subfamily serine protease